MRCLMNRADFMIWVRFDRVKSESDAGICFAFPHSSFTIFAKNDDMKLQVCLRIWKADRLTG